MKSSPRWLGPSLVLAAAVIFLGHAWREVHRPSRFTGHYHGDFAFSELGTFVAGLNFAQCGFIPLRLTPAVGEVRPDCAFASRDFYLHMPPAPELLSGLLQKLGVHRYAPQKLLPYLVSLVALGFLTAALAELVARAWPAQRRLALWAVPAVVLASPYFIYWAGSLWEFSYRQLFLFAGLWLLLRNRLGWFVLASFLLACFEYEWVPFMFLLGGCKLAGDWRAHARSGRAVGGWAAAFFLAPCLAVAIHFFQNAWFLGGVGTALGDLVSIGVHRSGFGATSHYSFGAHLAKQFYAALWFYGSGLLVLAVIGAVASVRNRQGWPLACLAGGLIWQVLMRQHCAVHAFTALDFGLGVFALALMGLADLVSRPGRLAPAVGYALLVLAVLRLPLGAEFSHNPLLLSGWEQVVHRTDSATLASLLSSARATSEHRAQKAAVVRELATRAAVALDAPAYAVRWGNTRFVVERFEPDYTVAAVPAGLLPPFRDEPPVYMELAHPTPGLEPVEIPVTGTAHRRRLIGLELFFRCI